MDVIREKLILKLSRMSDHFRLITGHYDPEITKIIVSNLDDLKVLCRYINQSKKTKRIKEVNIYLVPDDKQEIR